MTKMAGNIFVDTNVLLRATFSGMEHHETSRECIKQLQAKSGLWISNQIVCEFYRQARRPGVVRENLYHRRIVRELEVLLLRFSLAVEVQAVHEQLMQLLRDSSLDIPGPLVHDANIVATMLAHEIYTLVTRDGDFQRFDKQITILTPAEILL